ncbi:membrane peptidoglycan carboxypeptidase [Pseudarthrobacter defluvii]|uniref:transglycosylase domain-containing protein n=1 Tax=Pseudarthrobacter defluvii TaxID=410837 RepID=UPI0027811B61|nr:transglycosylase domain-containing protein [Pseudarthrobacter defluvii]MDQ0769418.1 membrane peptidoglycan carboxypeptidase [Pseudarthrobacter defluvii]
MLIKDILLRKAGAFIAAGVIGGFLVAGLLAPAAALGSTAAGASIRFLDQLPSNLNLEPPARKSRVLAKDESVIATFYAQNRVPVDLEQMSPFIRDGIVAIEDARFYDHGGIDPTGILRALYVNAQGGRQGASTITQQYIKNVLILSAENGGSSAEEAMTTAARSIGDKLREMKLAVGLEEKYSKDQILQGYLNLVYFGNGAYGIQAAAKTYFGVAASALSLPQAAALAGVVNRPAYYDPLTQPDHVVARRNEVLDKMLQQGYISPMLHDKAAESPLALDVQHSPQGCAAATAPYFCDYIQRLILNDPAFGADEAARHKLLYQGGLTIRTTLDPGLQKTAQEQVNASLPATDPLQRGAALVSVEPGTGKILTMAQNTIYDPTTGPGHYTGNLTLPEKDSNGNPLHGAGGFQIGSTMKPFVFAEWLNSGRSMATELDGSIRTYKADYPWKNSCGTTTGSYDPALGQTPLPNDDPYHYYRMSVLKGLYHSINTITFQSATQLDFCKIQKMATAAGVKNGHTNKPYDLSSIASLIGTQDIAPLDMATAYATFAAGGIHCNPIAVESVTGPNDHNYPVTSAGCEQTIAPDVAAGVTYALKPVLTKGSGYNIPVNKEQDIFAKTGTTDGHTQTWTVGATTGIATASWFGSYKGFGPQWANEHITINGTYYAGLDGANIAGTQWAHLMNAAEPKYPGVHFPAPPPSMLR